MDTSTSFAFDTWPPLHQDDCLAWSERPSLARPAGDALVQRCGGNACPPSGCDREENALVRPSRIGPGRPGVAPAAVHETLAESGIPLAPGFCADAQRRFGHSFDSVRIHTSSLAAESAAAIQARAYTVGSHIAFAAGAAVAEQDVRLAARLPSSYPGVAGRPPLGTPCMEPGLYQSRQQFGRFRPTS